MLQRGSNKDTTDKIRDKSDNRRDKQDRERMDSDAGDLNANEYGENKRGMSRGSRRGGRVSRGGRMEPGKEPADATSRGYGPRLNGPGRGGGSRGGRGGRGAPVGRTFASRARDVNGTYNTIDVWENSQADTSGEATTLKVGKSARWEIEKCKQLGFLSLFEFIISIELF